MRLEISWSERATPLSATAVFMPSGHVSKQASKQSSTMIQRLLALNDDQLHQLEGVSCSEGLFILGDTQFLPWVDGCQYLGKAADAPHLYMSTLHQPNIPEGLLDTAFFKKHQQLIALLPNVNFIVPLLNARVLSRDKLQRIG